MASRVGRVVLSAVGVAVAGAAVVVTASHVLRTVRDVSGIDQWGPTVGVAALAVVMPVLAAVTAERAARRGVPRRSGVLLLALVAVAAYGMGLGHWYADHGSGNRLVVVGFFLLMAVMPGLVTRLGLGWWRPDTATSTARN